MAACPDGGADKGTFTPFNSPVRQQAEEPVCSLARSPSPFDILHHPGGRGAEWTEGKLGASEELHAGGNYDPSRGKPANRCGFLDSLPLFPLARNKGIVPPAVSLAPRIVAYVVFAPYDTIFFHLKLERARER